MIDKDNPFFEISTSEGSICIKPIERINYNSDCDWDKNWLKTLFIIKGGNFSGKYTGTIMTLDIQNFLDNFSLLYDNLNGSANFQDIEGFLELKIRGDGLGHFSVLVIACDNPGADSAKLEFTMNFDQTFLKDLIGQLRFINKKFPIAGKISKKATHNMV